MPVYSPEYRGSIHGFAYLHKPIFEISNSCCQERRRNHTQHFIAKGLR